jgi:hypothetical protein
MVLMEQRVQLVHKAPLVLQDLPVLKVPQGQQAQLVLQVMLLAQLVPKVLPGQQARLVHKVVKVLQEL